MAARRAGGEDGFSIIELVIVISITALVAGSISRVISRPMEGYRDVALRGTLVDAAESAVQRMERDIQAALPNSIRVSGDAQSLEMIHVADAGRYRAAGGVNPAPSNENHNAGSDRLVFASDASFNILGRFTTLVFAYGTPLAAGHRLVIYPTNTAQLYADAATAADPGVITPSATTLTIADDVDEDQLQLSSSFSFDLTSPRQRVFVVDEPVSYLCTTGAGELTRYAGYAIASVQPTNPVVAPLSAVTGALVTARLGACSFSYDPGTAERSGRVGIDLTVSQSGEQIRLFHQVHVSNVP